MDADYAGAIWIPGPNHFDGRMGYPIRYVVIHGTGYPETLDQYIAEGPKTGGVHYMVGRDGRIVQFVREADASWANGKVERGADAFWRTWRTSDPAAMTIPGVVNPNLTSISIEHEKYALDNSDPLTAAQQRASFELCAYLARTYRIPARRATGTDGGFVPHASMEPVTRGFCPGSFPWDALFAYLTSSGCSHVPSGWSDAGSTLRPPSGQP
ncbi:MAG TPA: N-acetylmuramoyl-L-alanine amidase [Ktedonobacterales bacterium]